MVVTEVQQCIRTESSYKPCLEFPVLIAAAQGYEGHFEGLPNRVQVVFDHLFEQERHNLWSEIDATKSKLCVYCILGLKPIVYA